MELVQDFGGLLISSVYFAVSLAIIS